MRRRFTKRRLGERGRERERENFSTKRPAGNKPARPPGKREGEEIAVLTESEVQPERKNTIRRSGGGQRSYRERYSRNKVHISTDTFQCISSRAIGGSSWVISGTFVEQGNTYFVETGIRHIFLETWFVPDLSPLAPPASPSPPLREPPRETLPPGVFLRSGEFVAGVMI